MSIFTEVSGQGQDIVIIHGWCCNHHTMQPIVDHLKNHYRVTCVDVPGSAGSKSAWHDAIESVHDIADLMLDDLPEKAIYLPWSFGGLITWSIASRYPERVERIIAIGSTPKFIEADNWPGLPQPGFQATFKPKDDADFRAFYKREFMGNSEYVDFDPKPESYHQAIKIFDETHDMDVSVLWQGVKLCDKTDLRKEFSQINCPIDLIWGDKDDCVIFNDPEKLKALNKNLKIHMLEGGVRHMSFWTHPELFFKLLDQLL